MSRQSYDHLSSQMCADQERIALILDLTRRIDLLEALMAAAYSIEGSANHGTSRSSAPNGIRIGRI